MRCDKPQLHLHLQMNVNLYFWHCLLKKSGAKSLTRFKNFVSSSYILLSSTNMPSNVEIKAHLREPGFVMKKAQELSGGDRREVLHQEDTFFHCPNGRLKLREFKEDPTRLSQLVFYDRPDTTGPKLSKFSFTESHHPDQLKSTLAQALGVKGIVKKTRTLIMVGQTRVHIDEVDGLGSFMELEVVMQPDQTTTDGTKIADDLMEELGIQPSDLVSGAYMDLILQQNVEGGSQ